MTQLHELEKSDVLAIHKKHIELPFHLPATVVIYNIHLAGFSKMRSSQQAHLPRSNRM